jgi:hypothetical protein
MRVVSVSRYDVAQTFSSAGWRDFPVPCSLCSSKTTGFTPWSFINPRTFIAVPSPGGEGQDEGGRQNKHEKLAWSANTDLFHRYVFYGTALIANIFISK